jgi:hypothetical protein
MSLALMVTFVVVCVVAVLGLLGYLIDRSVR